MDSVELGDARRGYLGLNWGARLRIDGVWVEVRVGIGGVERLELLTALAVDQGGAVGLEGGELEV